MQDKKESLNNNCVSSAHKTSYTFGNTIIHVNEFFKKDGPTLEELLENVILYEGRMAEQKKKLSSKD